MTRFLPRKSPPKQTEAIAREWDELATARMAQIDSGTDTSFHEVLVPSVMSALLPLDGLNVLDVGCGTGTLTELIAARCAFVTGVDPSTRSVDLAMEHHSAPNITYVGLAVEDFSLMAEQQFDAVVANMVLMDVADLGGSIRAIARLSKPGARLVATFTHPLFWPLYWGYVNEPWFNYLEEIFIEAPFAIAAEELPAKSTHIHRPMHTYIAELYAAGFHDVGLAELAPPEPSGERAATAAASFPRFAMLTAVRGV